jgi:hypothetical protein
MVFCEIILSGEERMRNNRRSILELLADCIDVIQCRGIF